MKLGDPNFSSRINNTNRASTTNSRNNNDILINPLSSNNIGIYKSDMNRHIPNPQVGIPQNNNANNGISNDIINIGTSELRFNNRILNAPKPYMSGVYQAESPENNNIRSTTQHVPPNTHNAYYLPRRLLNISSNIMNPTSFGGAMMNSTVHSAMGTQYQSHQTMDPATVNVMPDPYLFRSPEPTDHMNMMNIYSHNPQLQEIPIQFQLNQQQYQQQQFQQQFPQPPLPPSSSPSHPPQLQQQQPHFITNKRRVTRACDYCRKRKIRCDPVNPATNKCTNCFKNDFECTFFFHEELERKKREAQLKELSNTDGSSTSSPDTVSHSNQNAADTLLTDDNNLTDELTNSKDPKVKKFMTIMNKRVLIIERKLKTTDNISKNMQPMLDKLVAADGTIFNEYQFVTRMIPRKYTRRLITPLVMKWILRETPTDESPEEYIKPIEKMFDHSIKWYLIQKKRIVNFSSFLNRKNGMKMYPLPDRDLTDILRCFYESVVHTSLIDHLSSTEIFQISQKYFVGGPHTLSFSETFFMNICIFGGIKFAVFQGINRNFLPDVEILKKVATEMFCNVMLSYNISNEGSADLLYLKGLLVLSKLCHLMLNSQIAYEILEQARRVALALGLNKDESYKNIPPNMVITRKGIWAYMLCRDRSLASDLSKPFLIKDSYLDYQHGNANTAIFEDIIQYHSKSTTINGKRSSITDADLQKITNSKDTRECLDVLGTYSEYIPFIINYHGFYLFELDAIIYKSCYYINTTNNVSFEEKFDEVVHINDRLRIWLESLSPAMRLDTYEEYFNLLKLKKTGNGIDHQYEGLCTRVLTSHLHFYSLSLTIAQFALSMIRDNAEASMRSKKDTKKLMIAFERQYLDSAEQILIIFKKFSSVSIRYLEIREYVMSTIFTLILNVIDNQGDKDRFIANALIIKNLQNTYTYMVNLTKEDFVADGVKFVVDLFFFAFLMKSAVLSFNSKNDLAGSYGFQPEDYDETIEILTNIMEKVKQNEIAAFKSRITSAIRPGSNAILTDITKEFLELLESEEYILNDQKINRKPTPNLKDLYDVVSMHPFRWDTYSLPQTVQSGPSADNLRDSLFDNNDGFFSHFPYSEFFYDRNFSFDETLSELDL
ncbi:hypothetical protein C6P45_002877 [Maudiozyma exigua]|uniref:Zn(2)-C6 fungal-type domain-containing protein n=1 Tax=Maudiozyma exigua TaxID=34358 RepID=A0A9P7BCQ7_MAUEX|nr:hypothetical protein C6P45_002877 [Kazachstania exigua]